MKKIYAIGMLCVLAASCLSCRKQVERIEYLPNYHQVYLFQNKSSNDYVLFRIYSSGPGGRAEDGFFVGKGYKDDSYHDVYSFDGANPFYLLPDATEKYDHIQRQGICRPASRRCGKRVRRCVLGRSALSVRRNG